MIEVYLSNDLPVGAAFAQSNSLDPTWFFDIEYKIVKSSTQD